MKIVFDAFEERVQPNFRGGEGVYISRMHQDEYNKVVLGMLPPGSSIGMHTHETSSETIFIRAGQGRMYWPDGSFEELQAGDCTYCPRGGSHSLVNTGEVDLYFNAVVPEHK